MKYLKEYKVDIALWAGCVLHAIMWGIMLAKWGEMFTG